VNQGHPLCEPKRNLYVLNHWNIKTCYCNLA
jgi:hypothetical protein